MLKNVLILLLSLTLLTACDGGSSADIRNNTGPGLNGGTNKPPLPVLQSITLNASESSIYIGESSQLTATAIYSDNSTKDITDKLNWSSTESNYTYSNTTKGLLYGIHAGTKQITVTYNSKTSKALELTVKPTLFIAFKNLNQTLLVAPYGLVSNEFPSNSTIYSLTMINGKVYGCCSAGISGEYDNKIGVFNLANKQWSFINNESNILESDGMSITNIKSVNHNLVINTIERTYSTGGTYYWDATNNKWISIMADISFPFVQKESRLYAVGIADVASPGDINYVDISKHLPTQQADWQTLVSAKNTDECEGAIHIINNHMYSINKEVGNFCISSINISESNASWAKKNDLNAILNDQSIQSSLVIESSIYVSFVKNDTANMVYKFSNLEENSLTPTSINLVDKDSNDVILANIGTTLYAGATDGIIWTFDTANPSATWQRDTALSQVNKLVTAMYVAY